MPNKIHNWVLSERQRWVLWLPVLPGLGMGLYFALPFEPSHFSALALCAVAAPMRYYYRQQSPVWIALLVVLVMGAGFVWAKLYTERQSLVMLSEDKNFTQATGQIVEIGDVSGGYRITLDEVSIDGLKPEETPQRVRLKLRGAVESLMTGDKVSMRAGLLPPSGPAMPGGFDFSRFFFFRGIGGVGYAIPPVTKLDNIDAPDIYTQLTAMREALSSRIRGQMEKREGSVAAALMMGDRTAIPEEVNESMRVTNLSHILAISGMHMAIVTGLVFVVVRYVLVWLPFTRYLRHTKKVAAACALAVGAAYLLISGQPLSAVRAFVMVALMLSAVLFDREVMPMRSLAWAALFLLLYDPSNILEPGFQLSFAATVGLIAFYEVIKARADSDEWVQSYRKRVLLYIGGILATTLVAEIATAPFVLYHFNNLSFYGMVANLLVMPLVSFVIMPFIIVAFLLLPVGLEWLPLLAVEWGIHWMLAIADAIAASPHAQWMLPTLPLWGLLSMALGGLWLCLWQKPVRLLGIALMLIGTTSFAFIDLPQLLISRDGKQIAAIVDGDLQMLKGRGKSFVPAQWSAGYGQKKIAYAKKGSDSFRCDKLGCIYRYNNYTVALVNEHDALVEDCKRADVVVTPFYLWRSECKGDALIIDRGYLKKHGTSWLWLRPQGAQSQSSSDLQGQRPWSVYRP